MHLRCFFLVKVVTIYALLVCKIFGPKMRLCNFFDKYQVCQHCHPRMGRVKTTSMLEIANFSQSQNYKISHCLSCRLFFQNSIRQVPIEPAIATILSQYMHSLPSAKDFYYHSLSSVHFIFCNRQKLEMVSTRGFQTSFFYRLCAHLSFPWSSIG